MTRKTPPVLLWLRRDLRLDDHPAFSAALAKGRPVIPVFIRDAALETLGPAARWRLGLALSAFEESLRKVGSRLILKSGEPLEVLRQLARDTGADSVHWSRSYDPATLERDKAVKAGLKAAGLAVESHPGFLLQEPWTLATKTGTPFRVYTPFWRRLSSGDIPTPLGAPANLGPPADFPASETLEDWQLARGMNRGARVVRAHLKVGEAAAMARLDRFLNENTTNYDRDRDFPALNATSGLSENLSYGEISPRRIWHSAFLVQELRGESAGQFLKELVWRDFAWHLYWHAPDLAEKSWNPKWEGFPWRRDPQALKNWQRGMTGVDLVDAGMREMHVTGRMHNRVRMVVASYLTKHLLIDWREGERFFAAHLVDFDPAANAMGWQWVAGSGPDAAPYFRIFNPDRQARSFDPDGAYIRRFLLDGPEASAFYQAVPRSWKMSPDDIRPTVDLASGRNRALAAYKSAFG